ncbi:S-layer homology domain-containing protein [Paenibacillus sp. UNCCL117]|uniref:DUF4430 domain-containing protein n=1 Tax=unclassified Paenibacillus TaxID=185978 RepID=UPI00088FB56C|nr:MULTISPECIES: DUF4430 domain-containing protein [unclassified Paenibacillus]SDE10821.1 S-layer homology domain-containing protein [Paenibacillus sp. cl123]SFW59854.1 S-layer homology domain-containing protein [Paenibacillus sp. UNCCL117]
MMYRFIPKPLIALWMSLMVLFSSLGVLTGPVPAAQAAAGTGPSSIRDWLPAPGQFVNEAGWGGKDVLGDGWTNNPGSPGVSLGSFGGSIVFKFDEPIKNDPKHPYGVDFTVFGNAFAGNEEPAGVAVAQDDGTGNPGPWYSIAGSEHYEDDTIWDYRVTYTNPEPEFTSPNGVNIPWADNQGGSGFVKTNSYHKHAYYPIPSHYPLAPADFNNQSYTYAGVKINVRKNAFGYPDTHGNGSAPYDVPANPYLASPVNGDPIDISWAVDNEGKPVSLSSVSYVKVYNVVQMDGGALGEIGPEISALHKVSPNEDVQETADLTGIVLRGVGTDVPVTKEVYVTAGVYAYEHIRINADKIKLTAKGSASTVFVNNQRGEAGTEVDKEITLSESKPKLVRVIAQDGIHAPKIYVLSITKGSESATADKTALYAAISDAEKLAPGPYTEASWQTLTGSLAAARIAAGNDAATQQEVDLALSALTSAIRGLENKTAEPQTISASLTISGYSATAGKSVTLALSDMVVENGKSAAYAIGKLLNERGVSFVNESGNYITSIGGLAVGDGGIKSGWMYLVNGQFAMEGIGDYVLKNADAITFVYTDDYEQDITAIADKTALNAAIAEIEVLKQGIYTDASWQTLQQKLKLAKQVAADSGAIAYHASSALAALNAAYQGLVQAETIAVSFAVEGYSAAAGKDVSLPARTLTVAKGQTAAAVIARALDEAGVSFDDNGGVYISSVGGLGAFDGGPNSGWLYRVDGSYPNVGMGDYTLTRDASIILRYTDDYRQEFPEEPDTVKPDIQVTGVLNGQEVSQPELNFQVKVTDNSAEPITPAVTLNGKVLSGDHGGYRATLVPGTNTIRITAADSSGNTAELTLSVNYSVPHTATPQEQLSANLAYLLKTVDKPKFGTVSGDWSVLAMARANHPVPDGYYELYYSNVVSEVKRLTDSNNGVLDKNKSTEHARAILALTAIGKDPRDVDGYDLTKALSDYDYILKQGLNGPIYALLALDSRNYAIPAAAEGKKQATRDNLVETILSYEAGKGTSDAGGWSLTGGKKADVDITAMAIQALAPDYEKKENVTEAVNRAVVWLAKSQNGDGSYSSFGSTSSESLSQVIAALSAIGIDASGDERFVKNGRSVMDALLTFGSPDGGFRHVKSGRIDAIATDQGTHALIAYDRLANKKNRLYDMTDVAVVEPGSEELPLPGGDQPRIDIPADNKPYTIPITSADANKEITVNIPEASGAVIRVSLPANSPLPQLAAVKGPVSMLIPKGARIESGDASSLELITSRDKADSGLSQQVGSLLAGGRKLDAVHQAITLGGSGAVQFNEFVTLTLAGMKGKEAAFIQNGVPSLIQKVADDQAGLAGGKQEYAYDSGENLIVKTKHFTDFIAFTSSASGNPGGGGGGETDPPPTGTVTLSVEKRAIQKDDVIPPTRVALRSGDTAWSLLKRELDSRGIRYEARWDSVRNSIYVESIDGDREFDHGPVSGWLYYVNDDMPNKGASEFQLKDGDIVRWRYSKDMGEDLKSPTTGQPATGAGGGGGAAPAANKTVIDIPSDITSDYVVKITKEHKDKELVTVNIPNVKAKVILNLDEVKDSLPALTAVRGDVTVTVDKGTALKSGERQVELLTALNASDAKLLELVRNGQEGSDAKPVKLSHAYALGSAGQPPVFDKPVSIVIRKAKDQLAGLIEGDTFTPIVLYDSEAEGAKAVKGREKAAYAFVQGQDLVIKTNHLAALVTYTRVAEQPVKEQPAGLEALYADASSIADWAVDAIGEATQQGFVSGGSYGRFNPKSAVTRAEFAKMLSGVLGLDTDAAPAAGFHDVTAEDWFYPYVGAAAQAGIVTGYNDRFYPNDLLSREELAVIVARGLALPAAGAQTAAPADIDEVADWAKAEVQSVIAHELMSGWDNRFQPGGEVTREMAAVVAMRAYRYKEAAPQEPLPPAPSEQPERLQHEAASKQIGATAAYLQQTVTDPTIGTIGGDWTVLALARSGIPVPDAYYAKYYANVEKRLKEQEGKLHAVKYTEYNRVILALTSIGKNVDEAAGYNLRERLADYDALIKQGINGPIFALIALDSKGYEIPKPEGVKTQTTRELLIKFILDRELSGGGWALGEQATVADADITAMVVQALTPYYESNKDAKAAIDRAIGWLSKAQTADGGYASGESANSESVAQVVTALSGLGINPHTDARFIKNGSSAVDALLGFAAPGGGFYHVKPDGVDNGGAKPGTVDPLATDQALYALVAFDRMLQGKNRLYDMTDVK